MSCQTDLADLSCNAYYDPTGTLYSREVQVDGEQVAIQVQDTPGLDCVSLVPFTGFHVLTLTFI